MTTTLEPTSSSANASLGAGASDDEAIMLFGCAVGLEPLNASSKGEDYHLISGKSGFRQRSGTDR